MSMEMQNVQPLEVIFANKLNQSTWSALFQVIVRRKDCVMKVVNETFARLVLDLKH